MRKRVSPGFDCVPVALTGKTAQAIIELTKRLRHKKPPRGGTEAIIVKKSAKLLIALLAAAVLISAASLIFAPRGGKTASVYLDGELFARIDLASVPDGYTLDVGGHNVIIVENGRISMLSADCPDRLCVRQGCATALEPVVCLPNRVIISLDGEEDEGAADIITGGVLH